MRRLLHEPIFHFGLLALALFGYFALVADPEPDLAGDTGILVTTADVEQMIEQYKSVWQRPPTRSELDALITASVEEEILVREALALGLEQGDAVIRNRLRQKMIFLTQSAAQALTPADDVLQQHLDDNAERFERSGQIAFEQIFLGQSPASEQVDAALSALQSGVSADEVGERSLLPGRVPLTGAQQIDGGFGSGFYASLASQTGTDWVGPLASGYGLHLVRITDVQPAVLPDLDAIRDDVLFDWRRVQADSLAQAQIDALKTGYQITTPDEAEIAQLVAP